jgi:hypothetical protein
MADRDALNHYLLVFDHTQGELIDVVEFGTETRRALQVYADTERQYEKDDLIEVVLLGSDSLETVKVTHANYFDGSAALVNSRFLDDAYLLLKEVRTSMTGIDRGRRDAD